MIQHCKGCACETECDDGVCPECTAAARKIHGPRIADLERELSEMRYERDALRDELATIARHADLVARRPSVMLIADAKAKAADR